MFRCKQSEIEDQDYIIPDNLSRIMLVSFYMILIAAAFLFYNFAVLPEIDRVKLLDFATRYEIMGMWIKLVLGFFIIPSVIMVVFGIKILHDKRYPSFGARVAVKTRIIRGKEAKKIGIRYLVLGLIAIALILFSINRTLDMHRSFMENPLGWATEKSWNDAGLKRPEQFKRKR